MFSSFLISYIRLIAVDIVFYNIPLIISLDMQCFKESVHLVLPIKAGIRQITSLCIPVGQSSVIKHLLSIFNNKRYDVVLQALLKCYQSSYSSAVLCKPF